MASFFPSASNFNIEGGNFTSVGGDTHYHVEDEDRAGRGIELLYQNMVTGASHDAEQRFPPPNCHPGTRIRILEILRHWIRDESKDTSIFWLFGPAGVGKSAIAQNICEEFVPRRSESSKLFSGHLAASFFFARRDPHRNNLNSFFTTIAYQLATSVMLGPVLHDAIDKAVRVKNDLVHTNLELQFQKLIFEPCTAVGPAHRWNLDLPKLVVIDGLDECVDIPSQERLLRIISETKSSSSFPLEFLICSRPEPRIKNAFSHKFFHSTLDCHDIGDSSDSREDIAKYLRAGFSEIHESHHRAMSHIPSPWPSEGIVQQLVRRACGQFIYASTVLKYVGDYHGFPPEQLEIILKITVPENFNSPYPDLDLLYKQILSTSPRKELLLDVLTHLVAPGPGIFFDSRYERTTSACIEGILFLNKGKVWTLLFGLHSVLHIPEKDHNEIHVLHASFIDFLTDPRRSGSYFIDRRDEARHERVAKYLLKRILHAIKHHEDLQRMNSQFDTYAWEFWYQHCKQANPTQDLLSVLDKLDVYGFVNTAMRRRNTRLESVVAALRRSLATLETMALWAQSIGAINLTEKYQILKFGFQAQHSSLSNGELGSEKLSQLIDFLKFELVMYKPVGMWDLISSMLNRHFDIEGLSMSYLSYSPIVVVAPLSNPRPEGPSNRYLNGGNFPKSKRLVGADTVNLVPSPLDNNLISIDFAECHHRVCIECLHVLRELESEPSSFKFSEDVIKYSRLHWVYHLLATRVPTTETLDLLQRNVCWLQTSEDTRSAIAWVSESSDVVLRNRLAKLLERRFDELVNREQLRKPLEKKRRFVWFRRLRRLMYRRRSD